MEGDGGVRAPVTRRRMKLPVEQSDEVKSSPAANTPTKRSTRRAAKSELDHIDENDAENMTSKKSGKKTVEEKPLTPSRRSTRIKSNTSIVSETTQGPDTPRGKRAARRNSQIGSDSEAPLTPARQTRRTRKDSSTNIEQADPQPAKQITEMILEEENESTNQKSPKSPKKSMKQVHSPNSLRQSPRLSIKNNSFNSAVESKDENIGTGINNSEEHNTSNKENEINTEKQILKNVSPDCKENNVIKSCNDINILSKSNADLLNSLSKQPSITLINCNKSTSAIVDTPSFKTKRHRTKSWTTLSAPKLTDNQVFSDSETVKKKRNSLDYSTNIDLLNISKNKKQSLSLKKNKIEDKDSAMEEVNKDNSLSQKKRLSTVADDPNTPTTINLFATKPSRTLKTIVYVDDSDHNSDKLNTGKTVDDEDQCVPKVLETEINRHDTSLHTENQINFRYMKDNIQMQSVCNSKNDSCEPMDVDVTLPDNINMPPQKEEDVPTSELNSKDQETECGINQESKKRKSSLSLSSSQPLEKTSNENKSTLVISELKDISNENNDSLQICTSNISKSDNGVNVTKEDKSLEENISSNYSTSTPLQQKVLKKLAMRINTSDITSNNSSKIEKTSKKNKSKDLNNSKTEEPITDEESEQEDSKLIDDEAEEASDDYESGDSKDEDEERYERENEILHEGETLSTDDELSNDTDYEKDSFIVSSNEEDEDLLDGSGDDLSLSDNELKMTEKSKEKYNQRKMKEQKNASREMFESRHKLNKSNGNIKSQISKVKNKSRVLDSSDDEDSPVQTKKKNRMRLDSSHEISVNKSLQNSLIQNHEITEKEITINEENANEEIDPLSIDVKKELVTPSKSRANDSVKFIDTEQFNENDDKQDKNKSVKSPIQDPLMDSNESSDSSESSENIHIQNYESILNELNENRIRSKTKLGDISLNLDKKTKKAALPIVYQLNLTQTKQKTSKKRSDRDEVDSKINTSVKKSVSDNTNSDNESSNSNDLHLLFAEESNSSENVPKSNKNNDDNFIPLKQSLGKTNILEDSGINSSSTIDSAKKKNKKRKSLNKSSSDNKINDNHMEVQFFIDTTGTHGPAGEEKSLNVSVVKGNDIDENSDSDPPVEVSNKSQLEKGSHIIDTKEDVKNDVSSTQNTCIIRTPKSDKKKKRISESSIIEQTVLADSSLKTPNDKKKKKKLSESQLDNTHEPDANSASVIKNSSTVEELVLQQPEKENIDSGLADRSFNKSISKTPKTDKKKKKKLSESVEQTNEPDIYIESEITANSSNVILQDNEDVEQNVEKGKLEISVNKSMSKTPKSEKKKKKNLSESKPAELVSNDITTKNDHSLLLNSSKKLISDTTEESHSNGVASNRSLIKTPNSEKKKARTSEPITISNTGDSVIQAIDNLSSAKKNKKKNSVNPNETSNEKDNNFENVQLENKSAKKRKRKSSNEEASGDQIDLGIDNQDTLETSNENNKRRKISHNTEMEDSNNEGHNKLTQAIAKQKSHNVERTEETLVLQNKNEMKDTTKPDNISKKKVSKKRKVRDDDEDHQVAKVLKVDVLDKVNVPRLPTNILNQLEDQPKKKNHQQVTKAKAISTSNFIVEEAKKNKNKPSRYLEESVYLNEDDEVSDSKKEKCLRITHKVLPFLPTVSSSISGCTTNFQVNVIPKEFKFVAKSSSVSNFKNDFLEKKKLKRFGTYDTYKRNRNVKLSKF